MPLKRDADEAIEPTSSVGHCVVVQRTGADVDWDEGRDHWYHDLVADQPTTAEPEPMDSEDLLYLLYTSGTTAKPKGIMHTTGGYLAGVAATHRYIFDIHPETDVYWCMADIGWVTGHSYIVYGPLANGTTASSTRAPSTSRTRTDGRRWRRSTAPRSCTPPRPRSGRS